MSKQDWLELVLVPGIPIIIFLIFLIWICKGFKTGGDLQKEKGTTSKQLWISVGLVFLCLPMALIIGGMATDSPSSTVVQFWEAFFAIEGLPLLCLLLTICKRIIQHKKYIN
ncbi:hypothetical protein J7E63_28065 [Bacillus sp. ISL-75]|uniref:hypothetical protein n=1 Tax=Bacillus sp. ISL-75 TaxID=2819137 RepID=UPI001BE7F823|nr:hypothetical protein [Bacillus sp. ISL-75]MBT2730672.1 hypothetical protein [Bacillus sp. ISL-75]